MKGAVKKGVSGSVMHEEEESEELQPEEPQSGIESVTETPKFTEVSDTVTDEFLKEALIELLGSDSNGEPDFSKEHEVTFLDLSGRFIQRLDGLQHLKSLQTLILDDNEISDLSPLSSLTRLKYLDVSGQNVEDILALSGLSGLEYLDISDNPVSSLAAVSGFAALKELDITDTGVTSLSPLSSLERLKSLQIRKRSRNPLRSRNQSRRQKHKKRRKLKRIFRVHSYGYIIDRGQGVSGVDKVEVRGYVEWIRWMSGGMWCG